VLIIKNKKRDKKRCTLCKPTSIPKIIKGKKLLNRCPQLPCKKGENKIPDK
jgi:hypothetical protein